MYNGAFSVSKKGKGKGRKNYTLTISFTKKHERNSNIMKHLSSTLRTSQIHN